MNIKTCAIFTNIYVYYGQKSQTLDLWTVVVVVAVDSVRTESHLKPVKKSRYNFSTFNWLADIFRNSQIRMAQST